MRSNGMPLEKHAPGFSRRYCVTLSGRPPLSLSLIRTVLCKVVSVCRYGACCVCIGNVVVRAPFVCELCYLLSLSIRISMQTMAGSPTGIQWTRHYDQNLLFSFFLLLKKIHLSKESDKRWTQDYYSFEKEAPAHVWIAFSLLWNRAKRWSNSLVSWRQICLEKSGLGGIFSKCLGVFPAVFWDIFL